LGWSDDGHRRNRQHPDVIVGVGALARAPGCLILAVSYRNKGHAGGRTYLRNSDAAVQLD
jgi:hypothetical protein